MTSYATCISKGIRRASWLEAWTRQRCRVWMLSGPARRQWVDHRSVSCPASKATALWRSGGLVNTKREVAVVSCDFSPGVFNCCRHILLAHDVFKKWGHFTYKSRHLVALDKLRRSGHTRPVLPSGNGSLEFSCGCHFG